MSLHGSWVTATIDIDATATGEFSGFDADQYSGYVDLGRAYDKVQVIIPTITSATISVYGIYDDGTAIKTNVPLPIYSLDRDATGSFAQATTAATTSCIVTFDIYGFQYIRIKSGENQAADRVFYCKGIKL
jgi:hypothetical protein